MNQNRTLTIAEVGMNHMGSETYASQYLYSLGRAQVDGLTFQVREEAYYARQKPGESPLLSDEYYRFARRRTRELGMLFGVGICGIEKVSFFEEVRADFYKILSKDIGNAELVAAVLNTEKPVYVSTGMSDEEEIGSFLASLGTSVPSNLSLIHTQLSHDDADTNLRAIPRLREQFGVPVAFGSHSTDANVLYASLGFEPSALFFYVKGSRPIVHKDEAHAISLEQCSTVIPEIRRLEVMMGDGLKQKMPNRIKSQQK